MILISCHGENDNDNDSLVLYSSAHAVNSILYAHFSVGEHGSGSSGHCWLGPIIT